MVSSQWIEPDAFSGEKKVISRNLPDAAFSKYRVGESFDDGGAVCIVDFINVSKFYLKVAN
jgi:hypothetical protein